MESCQNKDGLEYFYSGPAHIKVQEFAYSEYYIYVPQDYTKLGKLVDHEILSGWPASVANSSLCLFLSIKTNLGEIVIADIVISSPYIR